MKLKKKLWNLSSIQGTRVPLEYFQGTELKFLEWNLSSTNFFFFKFYFAITQLSKNRVLHLKLEFQKIEFQNRGISLNSFKREAFYWKVCQKWVFCHFGHSTCPDYLNTLKAKHQKEDYLRLQIPQLVLHPSCRCISTLINFSIPMFDLLLGYVGD